MFISKEFKAAMNLFKEARQAQAARTQIPIKEVQLYAFANGIFGLLFLYWGSDSDTPFRYLLSAGCLFVTVFFWGIAIWLHLATPKGSKENWPSQFRTAGQIRSGFFRLENYPKLHPQSSVIKGVRWATKKLKKT